MASVRKKSDPKKPRRPPASSIEARENQMVALAVDLAEKQLADGSASSQVMTHYLKLGSVREGLEREKLRRENKLLAARSDAIESAKRVEELYSNALSAMRNYAGHEIDDE